MKNKILIMSILTIVMSSVAVPVLASYPMTIPKGESITLGHPDFGSWAVDTRYPALVCIYNTSGTSATVLVNYSTGGGYDSSDITILAPGATVSGDVANAQVFYPSIQENSFYLNFVTNTIFTQQQLNNTSIKLTNKSDTDIILQSCTTPAN